MTCCKPKCRVKSDDPMVVCWICDAIYHAKCVDLAARTADNLHENKGLRWCCKKCLVFDLEFYSFLKNTRNDLNDLNNDLKGFMKKFSKYKDLFDKAPCSPKRKKASGASSTNSLTTPSVTNPVSSDNNTQLNSPSGSSALISPLTPSTISESQAIIPSSVPKSILSQTPNTLSSVSIQNEVLPTITSSQHQSTTNLPRNDKTFVNGSNGTANNHCNPVQLKVITPKRTIFAARFASETTTDAVKGYINYKLGYEIDITVFKFKYSEQRSKSSFKIIVPAENFDTIVNPNFWPPNAIIHEYEYRNTSRSDIVRLPSQGSNPKN